MVIVVALVLLGPTDPEAVLSVGGLPLEGREVEVLPAAGLQVRAHPEVAVAVLVRRGAVALAGNSRELEMK